jgi:protocatechuate 3,4-dioxygenase beta subunit
VSFDTKLTLRGHVVFPDGKAVPGAEVVLQSGPGAVPGVAPEATVRDGARRVVAGADGVFAFDNLRVGTYVLGAVHDDDVAPTLEVQLSPGTGDVTLVMFPGAGVEVAVRAAGTRAPIAGATVKITDGDRTFGEQWSLRTAQTDAQGIAKFRGMNATASHVITATAAGYAENTVAAHDFQFADRNWTVEVLLKRAARVSGRVVDANGHGLANATVAWELGGQPRPADTPDLFDPFPFHGHFQAVQTDAEGRFALDAEPGSGCVLAAHPTHELGEICGVAVAIDSERSGLEIVLRDGGRVSGQVVWSDGTPAAGATVIATKRGWIHQPIQSKSYRFETRTGLDGRFELRGIKRGELDLAASTDEASSPLVPVDLSKRADQRDITIKLSSEGTIRGRVVDEAKQPIAYAVVKYAIDPNMSPPAAENKPRDHRRAEMNAQHPDFALPRSIGATRTDRDGTFAVHGLPDGLYTVIASRPEPVDLPTALTSTTQQSVAVGETVELVLRGIGGVKGRVVDENGKPVTAFGISLARTTAATPHRYEFSVDRRIVSGDGTFQLTAIPSGTYRVRVDGENVTEQIAADAVTVKPGAIADVGTLKTMRGVRRHGIVLAKDKTPVAAARVIAQLDPRSEALLLETDDSGAFVLPPLPADATIRVRADHFAATSDWVTVPPSKDTIELVLIKEGVGSISGVLVESGARLERRSIVLTLVGDGTPDDKLATVANTVTGDGGTFKFDTVQVGDYLVWVRRFSRTAQTSGDVWWKQEAPVHVEATQQTQVVLAVPPQDTGSGTTDTTSQGGSGQGSGGKK